MSVRSTIAAFALLCAALPSGHAAARDERKLEPVPMREDLKARERAIASTFFSAWLDGNRDGHAETGIADLNGDGTAEIFVRLVHSSTCDKDMKVCRTFVLMHDGRQWQAIFDRPAGEIALGRVGKNGMRDIVVNGFESRVWNGHAYQIDLAGLKTTAPKFQEVVGQRAIELSRGFGNAAEKLVTARQAKVEATAVDLGAGRAAVVRLTGRAACGIYLGCPFRVLVDDGHGREVPVLEAGLRPDQNGRSDLRVLEVTRGGWKSIATVMPDGTALVADWQGGRYAMETRR